jgi:hypothetical protein
MPPNTRSWVDALETFLCNRGYKLRKVCYSAVIDVDVSLLPQDSLRRRFSKALQWYNALVNATENKIQVRINDARPLRDPQERPSEYLRSRCPLCFGGEKLHNSDIVYVTRTFLCANADRRRSADVIVCIDACFTQKRHASKHNPQDYDHPLRHPNTVFVPEEDVKAMKEHVATCRASSSRKDS